MEGRREGDKRVAGGRERSWEEEKVEKKEGEYWHIYYVEDEDQVKSKKKKQRKKIWLEWKKRKKWEHKMENYVEKVIK